MELGAGTRRVKSTIMVTLSGPCSMFGVCIVLVKRTVDKRPTLGVNGQFFDVNMLTASTGLL